MAKVNTENGKVVVSLENGPEVFNADDPLAMTHEIAKALDSGKKWGKEGWAKADTVQEQFDAYKAAHPETIPPPVVDPSADPRLDDYLLRSNARSLGLTPEQLKALPAIVIGQQEAVTEWKKNTAVATFQSKYPDFPNTEEANTALVDRAEQDFKIKLDDLAVQNPQQAAAVLGAAHLACVNEGVYKPLTKEQQNMQWADNMQQASRGAPPPMVRSNNPESQSAQFNEYAVPVADLRARYTAMAKELGGQR